MANFLFILSISHCQRVTLITRVKKLQNLSLKCSQKPCNVQMAEHTMINSQPLFQTGYPVLTQ